WSSPGRNHGPCHAGGQFQPAQRLTVRPGQHPGSAAGLEFSGSQQTGGTGPHVRRRDPPGDYLAGQHLWGSDTAAYHHQHCGRQEVTPPDHSPGTTPDARPKLERSLRDRRTLISTLLSVATGVVTVLACIPLFSTLIMLLWRGGAALSWHLFVE